ncbi:MAG: class I SAM-dependent methyltransferase, partial [Lachnospiraceae bacterium]|nr:class I SAM-dependent methyltransferase [Lachnospiraceae bacterium]
ESHMSLESVKQLQTMNRIMKDQFETFPVSTAMVLGVAGGNGLEHIRQDKYRTVYGVDINGDYLRIVSERYAELSDVLKCLKIDLICDADQLPEAQLLIANLLIEYIGYNVFQRVICKVDPEYVSCVIQINADDKQWVSDSPYLHAFDRLDDVHHQIDENSLASKMQEIGYKDILQTRTPLPNGKAFVRMDFLKEKQG